jgi:hypothetical protein
VDYSDHTVIDKRTVLEETSQIRRFRWVGGNETEKMIEVDDAGRPVEETGQIARFEPGKDLPAALASFLSLF